VPIGKPVCGKNRSILLSYGTTWIAPIQKHGPFAKCFCMSTGGNAGRVELRLS